MRNQYPEARTRLIEYINQYYREHNSSPSLRNIAAQLNLSKSAVQRYLLSLCDEGLIDYDETGIITEEMRDNRTEAVQIGVLNAGSDIPDPDIVGIRERFQVPASLFGNANLYLIRINGDKLGEGMIDNGDMILFRKQSWARKGDLAIAFVPDHGTVLVRMTEDLHPSKAASLTNQTDSDKTAGGTFRILGVVKKVIRDV